MLSRANVKLVERKQNVSHRNVEFLTSKPVLIPEKNVERAFELIAKDIYDTLDLSDIDTYIGSIDSIKLTNDKSLWQKMGDCFWRWLFFWRR